MDIDKILKLAEDARNGSRTADYGDVLFNLKRISDISSNITGVAMSGSDVAAVLLSVKLARESFHHKEDNIVDAINYLLFYGMAREQEENG